MCMAILVIGGAGYIGSHTVVELLNENKEVIVVDNFSNSKPEMLDKIKKITNKDFKFYELDYSNKEKMDKVFAENKIDSVIHFAGYKAVGESVEKPIEYYTNNVSGTLNLLDVMRKHNVKTIIFSSSATVYGDPEVVPLTEMCKIGGTTNPYGSSKLFIEQILKDVYKSDNTWDVCILRYFNPIGSHESGIIGEEPQGRPNNLMPYIVRVASGELEELSIFGNDYNTPDGTGVRDYIHVVDLAKGHIKALEKLEKEKSGIYIYNLGTGKGYSVLDMINAFEKSTGKTIGDEEICWMVKEGFEPNDLKFVLDQMSICQIRHYLVKQSEKSGDDISHVLQVWNDYLSMAKRLGMDIHDSIIYRTRDLQLRHKEAVLKIEEMKRGIRRRELEEKYVGFQKHLIDLKEKYEFSDGEYQVIAPKSIDDILYEGDTLHHCVNKTDTYFDRIVSKESYILFLREKENPKVPFYTLEVEPDGTIRQKRAEFNRQNKDIDKVTSFLTLWQKEIQKRLTKKDRKSTEESRKLRQQNYQEIRDKHVVVHGGAFAGELLADLLEKDLMDLPVESAENGESPTEIAA